MTDGLFIFLKKIPVYQILIANMVNPPFFQKIHEFVRVVVEQAVMTDLIKLA